MKFTIEDLRNGNCSVINDGTFEELLEVLKLAFPNDKSHLNGDHSCYCTYGDKTTWNCGNNGMPTQSVKDFLNHEKVKL